MRPCHATSQGGAIEGEVVSMARLMRVARGMGPLMLLVCLLGSRMQAAQPVLPVGVVWIRRFGANADATAVEMFDDGNVIVAGSANGSVWPELIRPRGGIDTFVGTWSARGARTPIWRWGFGGVGDEVGSDGPNAGGRDVCVLRIDAPDGGVRRAGSSTSAPRAAPARAPPGACSAAAPAHPTAVGTRRPAPWASARSP